MATKKNPKKNAPTQVPVVEKTKVDLVVTQVPVQSDLNKTETSPIVASDKASALPESTVEDSPSLADMAISKLTTESNKVELPVSSPLPQPNQTITFRSMEFYVDSITSHELTLRPAGSTVPNHYIKVGHGLFSRELSMGDKVQVGQLIRRGAQFTIVATIDPS